MSDIALTASLSQFIPPLQNLLLHRPANEQRLDVYRLSLADPMCSLDGLLETKVHLF